MSRKKQKFEEEKKPWWTLVDFSTRDEAIQTITTARLVPQPMPEIRRDGDETFLESPAVFLSVDDDDTDDADAELERRRAMERRAPMPAILRSNRDAVMDIVSANTEFLEDVDDVLKDDKEIILAAIAARPAARDSWQPSSRKPERPA